jgi:glyoxylase-like metal-dependent hydrolase (beta-lactamase superfamily II)
MFTPDMNQAHASVRKIADLDIEVCCFGHGSPLLTDAQERLRAFAASL